MSRCVGYKNQSKTILIFTEGPSEVAYFNRFKGRNHNVAVVPVVAKKHDSKNLISYCKSRAYEYGVDIKNGDSISVVIDVDDRTEKDLEDIEKQCFELEYELYLSNRSFECWLLMHFKKLTKPMSQDNLEFELSCCIGKKYCKSEGICRKITDKNVNDAISYASCIISNDSNRNRECVGYNPSTTVHLLVQRIMRA